MLLEQDHNNTNEQPQIQPLSDPELNNNLKKEGDPDAKTAIRLQGDSIQPSTPNTETQNPELQTEEMEVHKHPHHVMHKKKWNEYVLEFFMLFLAVFLGFIAENQREHIVERNREKEYIISMVEDLKTDTTNLRTLINRRRNRIRELDTVFELVNSDRYVSEGATVYRIYSNPYWDIFRFFPTDRTMQQLKNAGGLRLIRKQDVSDAIIFYDVWVRNRKEYESIQVDIANELTQHIEKLINPVMLRSIERRFDSLQLTSDSLFSRRDLRTVPAKITIPKLEEGIKISLLKNLYSAKSTYLANMRDNISEEKLAEKTLELIKKEYHIN